MTVKMFHDRFTYNYKHANDTLFAKKLSASTKYVMPDSLGTYTIWKEKFLTSDVNENYCVKTVKINPGVRLDRQPL